MRLLLDGMGGISAPSALRKILFKRIVTLRKFDREIVVRKFTRDVVVRKFKRTEVEE